MHLMRCSFPHPELSRPERPHQRSGLTCLSPYLSHAQRHVMAARLIKLCLTGGMNAQPPPAGADGHKDALINETASWLMTSALATTPLEEIFGGCCDRLLAAGVPIMRGHVAFQALHPLYASVGLTWRHGEELEKQHFEHQASEEEVAEPWKRSPLFFLIDRQLPYLRRRLTGPEALLDFPFLEDQRAAGATDYLAYAVYFGGRDTDGIVGSWVTHHEGGFTDQQIEVLQRIQKRFAVACKMRIREQIAENAVTTYLGRDAGLRVLDGQIRRGDGETLKAAFWYSDLRGSTHLAEELAPAMFIDLLNSYFEISAGAVLDAGGEIISFIGDAFLAAFPITADGDDTAKACTKALSAYKNARRGLADLNAERKALGLVSLQFGSALHLGSAVYGNIGVRERLAFTVIGSTINEVARLESLTKKLGADGVASAKFAATVDHPWQSLGHHELRGIEGEIEIFALPSRKQQA